MILELKDLEEYDAAAEYCARRGLAGNPGDPLPPLLSASVKTAIDADIEAFQQRIKDVAYGLACEHCGHPTSCTDYDPDPESKGA